MNLSRRDFCKLASGLLVPAQFSIPADFGILGAVTSFATLNPSDKGANITLSGGNLTAVGNTSWNTVRSTSSKSTGKYYFEFKWVGVGSDFLVGVADGSASLTSFLSASIHGGGYLESINGLQYNGSGSSFGFSTARNNFYGIAVDITNKLMWVQDWTTATGWWGGGGTTGNPATGSNGFGLASISTPVYAAVSLNSSSDSVTVNFGASAFVGTVPSGFTAGFTA